MPKFIITVCILLFGYSNTANAQYGFCHEIGIVAGPVAFQSDYGERYDFKTNAGNTGFGVGLVHYLNFTYDSNFNYTDKVYFNDHFRLRTELSYSKTKFNHFGKWVELTSNSLGVQQLRAMNGSTAVTNLGMQLEFFPFSISDFTVTTGSLAPFVSFGGQFSFYNSQTSSTMGPLGTPLTTFPKYLTPSDGRDFGFASEGGTVLSVVTSMGTRYKLSPLSDLMVDLRLQYYFSDWVDGLNQNKDLYKENKANDWLVWFTVGYIFYPQ